MYYILGFICISHLVLEGLGLPVSSSQRPCPPPKVSVRNGSYFGIHSTNYKQDFFLGIPFAQPPVDDLRLRIPASLNRSWTHIRPATEYGYACIGYGEDTAIGANNYVSEDCLTLNIVRPSGYEDAKLPVGVWIYGGGFYEGSSLDPRYNLSFIVQQSVEVGKPFIGVSINYRLHGWGFLWSEEVVKAGVANLGLRDQRLALHWIQENIHAFNGDPNRVTIWGESSGAISVGLHLLAYNGRDDKLFSGAIAESGPPSGVGLLNPSKDLAEVLYTNITTAAGCGSAVDKLACLRLLSTAELNNILEPIEGESYYQIYFGPLQDGDIIARGGNAQLLDGSFVKVPYILGENSDDGTDFPPFGLNNDSDFINFFSGFDFDNTTMKELLVLYPNNPSQEIPLSSTGQFNSTIGLQFKRAATLIGDLFFKAPRRLAAQQWTKHTNVPLYSYRFNAIPNGIPDYFGVTHWQEVPFVFHNVHGYGFRNIDPPYFGPDPFANRPQSFTDLATLMSRMWATFIHDGNPNFPCGVYWFCRGSNGITDSCLATENATHWPPYRTTRPTNFVFDANRTSYLEDDTYRGREIEYLVQKYKSRTKPWRDHDMS